MRKVRARLLKLNDILDGDDSDSDEEKAPDVKTSENAPSSATMVPPPIPQNMPPLPPPIPTSQVVPPPQVIAERPRMKK